MTNGPRAKIAEIVANTLPRSRSHDTVHREPHYYPIRNHLVDFLVTRSKQFASSMPAGYDPRHPPLVAPGLTEAAAAPAAPGRPADKAVVVNLRH
jgi:nitrate/nitrite transport system ATP-binding protein